MTIETILGIGVGVRAAAAPLTAGFGQSFTLRSQDPSSKLYLVDLMTNFAVTSDVSIRSPRMHDNVLGIDINSLNINEVASYLKGVKQEMVQQDNLQVVGGVGGGAATFDNVFISLWYENLVGMSGDLRNWADIKLNIKNLLSVRFVLAASAVGNWGAAAAINATDDLFKANTKYAILGVISSDVQSVVGLSGPCTGNVILGIPAVRPLLGVISAYLVDLSIKSELACIPVMESSDKAGTFLTLADQTGAGCTGALLLAELGS